MCADLVNAPHHQSPFDFTLNDLTFASAFKQGYYNTTSSILCSIQKDYKQYQRVLFPGLEPTRRAWQATALPTKLTDLDELNRLMYLKYLVLCILTK